MSSTNIDGLYYARCIAGVIKRFVDFYKAPIKVLGAYFDTLLDEELKTALNDRGICVLDNSGCFFYTDRTVDWEPVYVELKTIINMISDKRVAEWLKGRL